MAYPKGRYICEVVAQGFDEIPSEKKTPYFFMTFRPAGRLNPGNFDEVLECDSYEREVKLYMSEKAMPFTLERLRELGWPGNSFGEIDNGGSHSFVGQQIQLVCDHVHNGEKTYDEWSFPFEGSSISHDKKPGIARKLDNLFGRELRKSATKPAPANETPQEQTVPDDYPDEEIPF